MTAWTLSANSSATRFAFQLPPSTGTPPAGAPEPGVYQLRVGSGALGSPGAVRSGATPFSVAAYVDPAGGPVLSGAAPYTITGSGFVSGAADVFVGTEALAEIGAAPAAGQASLAASGNALSFTPPAGPAGTVLPLRVRVNGIESDPALWVAL